MYNIRYMEIKIILKVKNCSIEFKAGMGPGVLAIEELDLTEPLTFADSAIIGQHKQALLDRFIEIVIQREETSCYRK